MTLTGFLIIVAHAPLVYWLAFVDRFDTWNRWADALEERYFPPWFQWRNSGDRVSWVHHLMVALGAWTYGCLLGWVAPDPALLGGAIAATVAAVGYSYREYLTATRKGGWTLDERMDLVGPWLVCIVSWILL